MSTAGSAQRPAYAVYRLFWQGLDWLYPPVCAGCGQPGTRWCADCQASTSFIEEPVCSICGDPHRPGGLCGKCRLNRPAYTALRSWAVFEGRLRKAMHRLKYKKDVAMGDALALGLIDLYRQLGWQVDLVVPVPLSRGRLKERGYNQAALLARPLALALNLTYQPKALFRLRETESQVGMSARQRRINLQGAFDALERMVAGKRVLVVDDVTTTGATIEACTTALDKRGCAAVYGLTLARAVKRGG